MRLGLVAAPRGDLAGVSALRCVRLCGLLALIKVLFVFPLIGNTLGRGRALPGPGSGVSERTGGPVLRGSLSWSFLLSPQKSRPLGGPPGPTGSLLRSVPPRDDPALPPSGGNLSPRPADPLPSLQGCNTRNGRHAGHQAATQGDETHVRVQEKYHMTCHCLSGICNTHMHAVPF